MVKLFIKYIRTRWAIRKLDSHIKKLGKHIWKYIMKDSLDPKYTIVDAKLLTEGLFWKDLSLIAKTLKIDREVE